MYPLVVSEGYVTVGSTGISSITISTGESGASISGELTEVVSEKPEVKKQKNAAAIALILGGVALIGGIIFIIFLKRKKDEEEDDD